MYGALRMIFMTSSSVKRMPASLAIAGRCSAALVEPPVAPTTSAAFCSDLSVTMSRGRMRCSINDTTARPDSTAQRSRSSYGAGAPAEPGNASPIASETVAIVLAVNCPPQAPAEGQATHSSSCRSASDIFPAACCPTASNTSTTVTSRPLNLPGRIEPPYMNTLGTLRRTIAIIMPGRLLSQPARPTIAS